MKKCVKNPLILLLLFVSCCKYAFADMDSQGKNGTPIMDQDIVELTEPDLDAGLKVMQAIKARRSVRSYSADRLSVEQISVLLWSCQGITNKKRQLRSAPSAGAAYPLEVYLVVEEGVYYYEPEKHSLKRLSSKNMKQELADSAYGQNSVEEADIAIIICAVYERVTAKYGSKGIRYTDMEAGHAAENIHLAAVSEGLASVPVGAFDENKLSAILNLPDTDEPIYVIPVGYANK